jgi:hypothetical protein
MVPLVLENALSEDCAIGLSYSAVARRNRALRAGFLDSCGIRAGDGIRTHDNLLGSYEWLCAVAFP